MRKRRESGEVYVARVIALGGPMDVAVMRELCGWRGLG